MCLFRRRQACFDLFEGTTVGIPSGDNNGCKLTNKGPPAKPKILNNLSEDRLAIFLLNSNFETQFKI